MSTNAFVRFFNQLLQNPNLSGKPVVYEEDGTLSLHFEVGSTQSKMKADDPYNLVLGYTRTIMGFLLFNPQPTQITMIGLGGGSLPKYCYQNLPYSQIRVIEINQDVIALRKKFYIPDDDERFVVVCADGADYVQRHAGSIDVLIVDGFDESGQAPQLCSQDFYDHCYTALDKNGVMVVNLFGTEDSLITIYLARIRCSFYEQVLIIDAESSTNKVVFAFKGVTFNISDKQLMARAKLLENDYAPLKFQSICTKLMANRRSRSNTPK